MRDKTKETKKMDRDEETSYKLEDTKDMLVLNKIRRGLHELLQPEVLDKLLSLQEELGGDNPSCMLERHDWFVKNGKYGELCPYAKMAKNLFLEENSDNVITLIKWVNKNWISKLEEN